MSATPVFEIVYRDGGSMFYVQRVTTTGDFTSTETLGMLRETDSGWTWQRYDGRRPAKDKTYKSMKLAGAALVATF